ncbi:MAG: PH domain-containing protein [Bacilli bacterium]|nr:PH domain-containing protein [Bacilli bacterium]
MNEAIMFIYRQAKRFRREHPFTVAFRLRAHSKVLAKHLNNGEKIKYVFTAQKGPSSFDIVSTYVIAITDRRIMIGRKRILFGYFFLAITPDMFNDIKVRKGLIWAKVDIDTIKEFIVLSNVSSSAAADIETAITTYVMREKKRHKDGKSLKACL